MKIVWNECRCSLVSLSMFMLDDFESNIQTDSNSNCYHDFLVVQCALRGNLRTSVTLTNSQNYIGTS